MKIDDPKRGIKVVKMRKKINERNVQDLYNLAVNFINKFLKIHVEFIGEASEEESESTEGTDDTEDFDEEEDEKTNEEQEEKEDKNDEQEEKEETPRE